MHHLDKVDNIEKHGNLELEHANNIPKGVWKTIQNYTNNWVINHIKYKNLCSIEILKLEYMISGILSYHQEPKSRIVNEDEESLDKYPWLAGVIKDYSLVKPKDKISVGCTGSLISKMYDYLFS